VLPDAFTAWSGSMYSNSPTTGDWESYVATDLVAHVDGRYRTLARRESRGLHYNLDHPERDDASFRSDTRVRRT